MLEKLKAQLKRLYEHPFYRERFKSVGLKPEDVKSLEDFQRLPFTTRGDLPKLAELQDLSNVVRIHFSPSPYGLIPVYLTKNDVVAMDSANAKAFKLAGVTSDDIALITFSYHVFIAGLNFHGGLEMLGAKVVPLGPGSTEKTLEIAGKVKPTVLVANPSFALKLAKEGLEGIRVFIGAGEPFSSIDGYKDKLRDAFGDNVTLIDYYGLAECVPIACECKYERGLHVVEDFCYVEVIDPESGEVVGEGERGELVVTHLNKEAMPLLRFRTGDLARVEVVECECGKRLTLPKGVFGRTDEMYKVKGVKFYPSQLPLILKGLGLSGKFKVVIERTEKGTDYLKLVVEGKDVDVEAVKRAVKEHMLITPNEVEVVEKLEKDREVLDLRF
jgi:phenylacetate-CoA ligase